jgi:hypothetical protein
MKNQKEVAIVNGLDKVEAAIDGQSGVSASGVAKMLLVGLCAMAILGGGVRKAMADGITVQPAQSVTIQNVYFTAFGNLNLVVPGKEFNVTYFMDFLHAGCPTAAGAETPVLKIPVSSKIVVGNLGIAAIVSGGMNKGIFTGSLNLTSSTPNLSSGWGAGPWLGSAFDGTGLSGGLKAYTQF